MSLPPPTQQKLRDVFGFATLREGQEPVIARLLAGKSVLAIFPTGGGKSLCYQLPALEFPELTLVVSPLIALMKDQLDFLLRKGIAAARIDSTLDGADLRKVMDELGAGRLRLLYIAPERLNSERILQTLRRLKLALLAVDEAHCISEWGHNFRPDYLKLARLARDLKIPRVLALTATATPAVAADIAKSFGIDDGDVIRTGFHRSNLSLHVTPCAPEQKTERLASRLKEAPRGPTIVYVTLQRTAEDVAAELARRGLPAKAYHAGLENDLRSVIQDWFMAAPDAIVVATIAFGMGIDKANIRHVIHYNLPKTLENYAQEIGRAGRDGLPSRCELLAAEQDRVTLENFTFGDTPTPESIAALVDNLLAHGERFDVSTYDLSGEYDIRPLVVETLLTYMELDGVLAATGPFYNQYDFQPLRPSAEILAKFDAGRQKFLAALFKRARKKKVWFELDVAEVSAAMKEPRERIVTALNYLVEQGDLKLQVAGIRLGYRRVTRPVREQLLQIMTKRFGDRERRDLERLQQVLQFAAHRGCKTRYLALYFGEEIGADCGHCGWCVGEWHGDIPALAPRALADAERRLIEGLKMRRLEPLATPRQLTRFLCGLSSPATSRARLTKEPAFGALAEVPFQTVLQWVAAPG
jgi:ATP-dependent DNA helicase RecQ